MTDQRERDNLAEPMLAGALRHCGDRLEENDGQVDPVNPASFVTDVEQPVVVFKLWRLFNEGRWNRVRECHSAPLSSLKRASHIPLTHVNASLQIPLFSKIISA
jgi:hypothetical protein